MSSNGQPEAHAAASMAAADALLADAERVAAEAQRIKPSRSVSKAAAAAKKPGFMRRVMREGVIMTALVAIIIAGINMYLKQNPPDKVCHLSIHPAHNRTCFHSKGTPMRTDLRSTSQQHCTSYLRLHACSCTCSAARQPRESQPEY